MRRTLYRTVAKLSSRQHCSSTERTPSLISFTFDKKMLHIRSQRQVQANELSLLTVTAAHRAQTLYVHHPASSSKSTATDQCINGNLMGACPCAILQRRRSKHRQRAQVQMRTSSARPPCRRCL